MMVVLRILAQGWKDERQQLYSKARIAWVAFTSMHSYRIPSGDRSPLLLLRYFPGCIRWILQATPRVDGDVQTDLAVLHITPDGAQRNQQYLEEVEGFTSSLQLYKSHLGALSWLHRLSLLLGIVPLCFFLALASLFFPSRYRQLAFGLREGLENACAWKLLQRHGIQKIYVFGGFEKDANLFTVGCQKLGIYVQKIPSSNSLRYFYSYLIADELSLTTAYHRDEVELLQGLDWSVNQVSQWPPMNVHRLRPLLQHFEEAPQNTLGLITRGVWLRKERGDNSRNAGELASELNLIEALKVYLINRSELSLTVFLHPIERSSSEVYAKAVAYYRSHFGNGVHVFDAGKDTLEGFDRVDVAISSYSSSNIERLYCGFKTLFAPLAMENPLFAAPIMAPITVKNEVDLSNKLTEVLAMSREEFFQQGTVYRFLAEEVNFGGNSIFETEFPAQPLR